MCGVDGCRARFAVREQRDERARRRRRAAALLKVEKDLWEFSYNFRAAAKANRLTAALLAAFHFCAFEATEFSTTFSSSKKLKSQMYSVIFQTTSALAWRFLQIF